MKRLPTVFLILSLTFAGGCSKKDSFSPTASPQAPTSVVLPQLEQNKMFQTNSAADSAAPDYSFHPVPTELETPSKDQAKDLPPAVD